MNVALDIVVGQHCEEAAFQWLLREKAVHAPHYSLKDLAKLDGRVDAHLDGLRVAGEAGWELCNAALSNEENGEIFAASVMAFESGIESRIQAVLEVVKKTPELSKGLISALGWMPFQQVAPHAQRLLAAESTFQRGVGLAAYAVHCQDPGLLLNDTLAAADLSLRARALKATGVLGRANLLPFVKSNLAIEDLTCRYWAAWSGALLGEPAAIPVLQRLAETGHAKRESACAMALRRTPVQEGQVWLKVLASNPNTLRMAVQAAGVIGDPAHIPWLIQQMANPVLARMAGEAFTMITGVDLAYEDLDSDKPEDFEAGPTESPEDETVDMDSDEDLPWPDVQLIEKWWFTHRLEFANGMRYLCGRPMTIESLNQVLQTGRQRQRTAAAIELAIRQPGRALFEVRAPGFRQLELLQ
jgi:uncharacterized protein (TIGR02270 family)